MRKKILSYRNVLICAILTMAVMVTSLPSPAAAAVGMKVQPGLGGLYKADQPLELVITVENSGPGFEGAITVKQEEEQPEKYRPDLARFSMKVNVPADAGEQYRMVIPGELASAMPAVELVSGDLVLAKSRVEGIAVGGARIILALSEIIMEQAWQNKSPGAEISLKYLSPGELPEKSLLLGAADTILIDPSSFSSLNDRQVGAVKEWVRLGGKLVLFGGAGSGEGEGFSDISPVRVTGKKTVDGNLAGLRFGGPLNVASGEMMGGKVLAQENGFPVLARREMGRGQVYYCGATPRDLGGEARGVWSTLLGSLTNPDNKNLPAGSPRSAGSLVYSSSYIPQLAGPPVPVLVLLWLLYVTAVGPLLYYLLRRADRRDWAWALVPAGALAAAAGFFFLAPANRLQNYLSQTLATIEVLSPELAEVRAGASFVVARGGDLAVQPADNMYTVPVKNNGGTDKLFLLVQQDGDKVSVNYGSMPYGSLGQAWAYGLQRGLGSIEGDLYLDGDSIKGNLVNKTGLDLRDSRLLLGGRVFRIGSFPAGGTAHVEAALEKLNNPPSPEMLLTELGGRRESRPGEPFFRESQLLSGIGVERQAGVQFLGWHDGAPGFFKMSGETGGEEAFGMVLLKQEIKLVVAPGRFRLPAGFIMPRSGELKYSSDAEPAGKVTYDGYIKLLYDIEGAGIKDNFKVEALDFQYARGQFTNPVEIYNYQQNKWEQLPEDGGKITAEQLSRYLNDNKVWLRVTGESRGAYPVWPGLAVEGVVS